MAKTASWIFGAILVIAGISGFFMQPALGFIAADTMSSILHIILGAIVLAMAGKSSASKTLKIVGIIYVLWGVIGFLGWNFVAADMVTNWFYLVAGIVMAGIGWSGMKGSAAMPMSSPSAPQM